MTQSEAPEVVIVGAGPAGMFLAYLLVTNGISVRVLERHTDFKREFRGEGIQPSVMAALDRLGFLPVLLERGIAVPAQQARIYMDEQPVVTLGGLQGTSEDFGLILFQEGFLAFLDDQCRRYPHYTLDMGTTVTDVVMENGRVTALTARKKGAASEECITGRLFVIAAGRNTALRKKVGLDAQILEAPFDIYWLKVDAPADPALIPDGFRAYLQENALFILYRTYDRRMQIAWGKRGWQPRDFQDLERLKQQLLAEAPAGYRNWLGQQFNAQTERQLLKVAADRMHRWSLPGMLFLGDAAHTMSPVAGQGINLAMRDSIVAANHLIEARRKDAPWNERLLEKIEAERRPEIEAQQAFQVRLGRLMLGAPRWQTRLVLRGLMPLFSLLGVRQWYVRRVQGGVTQVEMRYPVPVSTSAGSAGLN